MRARILIFLLAFVSTTYSFGLDRCLEHTLGIARDDEPHTYDAQVSLKTIPHLLDHQLGPARLALLIDLIGKARPLYPGAGYLDRFALYAEMEDGISGDKVVKLEKAQARGPLWIDPRAKNEITLTTGPGQKRGFAIYSPQSIEAGGKGVHSELRKFSVEQFPEASDPYDVRRITFPGQMSDSFERVDLDYFPIQRLRDQFVEVGLFYGPAYSLVRDLQVGFHQEGSADSPTYMTNVTSVVGGFHTFELNNHRFHPAILDSALQTLGAGIFSIKDRRNAIRQQLIASKSDPGVSTDEMIRLGKQYSYFAKATKKLEGKVAIPMSFGTVWMGSTRKLNSSANLVVKTKLFVDDRGIVHYDLSVEDDIGAPLLLIRDATLVSLDPAGVVDAAPFRDIEYDWD